MKLGLYLFCFSIRNLSKKVIKNQLKKPEFVIIGPQKCGTTSLYRYLLEHPNFLASKTKEVHYYDRNYYKGFDWYKSNFPSSIYRTVYKKVFNKKNVITGESTPYYFNCPFVPERMSIDIPYVKVIIMLRNPIYRAYSHYYHERSKGYERLSIESALKKERERLKKEYEKFKRNKFYFSIKHQHYSYLDTGYYAKHLKKWFKYFKRDQILIIKSEDFFSDTDISYLHILKFLNLPPINLNEFKAFNTNKYPPIDLKIYNKLAKYYEPLNEELYELLGYKFNW